MTFFLTSFKTLSNKRYPYRTCDSEKDIMRSHYCTRVSAAYLISVEEGRKNWNRSLGISH